eukprot:Nitzschia sp. Nitz4//scaffold24_size164493//3197//4387//NITZ4_002302-RA/size164493-processed-gene-0.217-mRNA-1//-1//CDS//3329544036//5110//frame0
MACIDSFPTRRGNEEIWGEIFDTERSWLIEDNDDVPTTQQNLPTLHSLARLHLPTTTLSTATSSSLSSSSQLPSHAHLFKKTGTTIAGCICRGHVILATDTRATEDAIVADKVAQKLHPLARNAWCAGAGTSGDLGHVTRLCRYSMLLQSMRRDSIGNSYVTTVSAIGEHNNTYTSNHEDETTTTTSSHSILGLASLHQVSSFLQDYLWDHQGQLGAYLILGCVSPTTGRPHLRTLHPHGNMDDVPFAALGSGGLAAMSVMEQGYQRDTLTVPEAIALVQRAIVAGIQNDMGSGSQVDVCVIRPDGTSTLTRGVIPAQELMLTTGRTVGMDGNLNDTNDISGDQPTARPTHKEGTYGFGNTPFGVISQRKVLEPHDKESCHSETWQQLLKGTKYDP